ncbi:glycoside hydrolase family protein [Bordetella sp. 02P26C-1]|nr:glycoside hydrolase family protein [Bordetella sp. 02P26C-1]
MTMGSEGLAVLKHYEGCKLTAYRDSVGVWTIGYGHTGPEVRAGLVWTQQQAEDALRDRLAREFVPGVLKVIKRSMRQCELDAMVDLAYNIGVGAFHGSTLVRLVNAGDTVGAADEFLRWVNAGGKPLLGLRRRRTADRALFLGATAQEAIKTGSAVT